MSFLGKIKSDIDEIKEKGPEKTVQKEDGELTIDLYETKDCFVIRSAVAGIKADDLDIAINNGILTIRGQRPMPETPEGTKYFYQECYWGPFSKQVLLPGDVDSSRAEASIKEGVLILKIPKVKRKIKKKIEVKEEAVA